MLYAPSTYDLLVQNVLPNAKVSKDHYIHAYVCVCVCVWCAACLVHQRIATVQQKINLL
jgi:hypothetical protein